MGSLREIDGVSLMWNHSHKSWFSPLNQRLKHFACGLWLHRGCTTAATQFGWLTAVDFMLDFHCRCAECAISSAAVNVEAGGRG